MHHQQHTPPGGAVCGQALSGLVPPTGAAGHGHQPPLQVPHIQRDAALGDRSRRSTADRRRALRPTARPALPEGKRACPKPEQTEKLVGCIYRL